MSEREGARSVRQELRQQREAVESAIVTAKKRMAAKLLAIKAELILRRHEPKAAVGEWLQKVVFGLLPLSRRSG